MSEDKAGYTPGTVAPVMRVEIIIPVAAVEALTERANAIGNEFTLAQAAAGILMDWQINRQQQGFAQK